MIAQMPPNSRALSGMSSSTGTSAVFSSLMTTGSGVNTAATTSDVIGSAYFLKASGVDSFGIAPSTMAKSAPYLTPETIVSSQAHPSTAGSIFSSIGSWLHSHFRIIDNRTKKIPS